MTPAEHHSAFDAWLRDHAAVLHHVAHGFAEGADRDDLMQELLLAVWRAVPAFRHGAQPSTFIYRVAHNAALTWKRSQKTYRRRLDRFEALTAHERLTAPAHTSTNPASSSHPSAGASGELASSARVEAAATAAAARDRETLELVYAHIRQLPPVDRSLILLHLDGLAYAEIAAIHGFTESNVGVRLFRLKQKLTASLKDLTHELR